MSDLCRQCRRQTTFDHEEESSPECCEHCQKNPELALVTQACSVGLTQLAETLRSGIDSEKRGINPVSSSKVLDSCYREGPFRLYSCVVLRIVLTKY